MWIFPVIHTSIQKLYIINGNQLSNKKKKLKLKQFLSESIDEIMR